MSSTFWGQPTRLQILWGKSPLPSIARFGRLVYPGRGEITNRRMFGGKSHRCRASVWCDGRIGVVRGASKGRCLNIMECLQPRKERCTEAAVRVLWLPTWKAYVLCEATDKSSTGCHRGKKPGTYWRICRIGNSLPKVERAVFLPDFFVQNFLLLYGLLVPYWSTLYWFERLKKNITTLFINTPKRMISL